MNPEKFQEVLNELIRLGKENGFVDERVIFEWLDDASKDQIDDCLDTLEDNDIEIVCSYTKYLNSLKDKDDKILFCYFILLCKLVHLYPDPEKYSDDYVKYLKVVIDNLLLNHFSFDERSMIKRAYGLIDGEYCSNFNELVDKFDLDVNFIIENEIDYLYKNVVNKILEASDKYPELIYQFAAISNSYSIEKFETIDIQTNDMDYLMYAPLGHFSEPFSPFICCSKDEREMSIGWILKKEEITHELIVYDNFDWKLQLFNLKDKPNPVVKYLDKKLLFSFSYGENGYNGYQFVFEKGKNIRVRILEKYTLLSETEIPYVFNGNIDNLFKFNKFNNTNGVEYNGASDVKLILNTEDNDGFRYCYKLTQDGEIELCEERNTLYAGMHTYYNAIHDFYGYMFNVENEDANNSNSVQLCIDNYRDKPSIRMRLNSDDIYSYVLIYDPYDILKPMCLYKYNGEEEVDKVDVLKEYFQVEKPIE